MHDSNLSAKGSPGAFSASGTAQEIVDNVPAGLLVLSEDLHVISVNRWFLDTFHLPAHEVLGHGLHEVLRPEGPPRREAGSNDEEGPHDVFLDLPVAGTSEKRPVRVNISSIAEGREGGRLLLVVEDVSESHRLRASAQRSEQRLRALLQSLDAIVWEADADPLTFTFVSQRAEQWLGYPVEAWIQEPGFWASRLHPEDREKTLEYFTNAIEAGRDFE
ncbi:MAG TPA: PAS domain-containing protein, partial [Terriglobia bacterium]|nr:PAS domain-containing protein [Terriglobia bacterium]